MLVLTENHTIKLCHNLETQEDSLKASKPSKIVLYTSEIAAVVGTGHGDLPATCRNDKECFLEHAGEAGEHGSSVVNIVAKRARILSRTKPGKKKLNSDRKIVPFPALCSKDTREIAGAGI